ncbi:phage portal protein [Listeria booriae]|uniref:Phage portal protein n=1 Tax=Listeria booriae TaxID=1552123 RepID=A0A7X0WDE6_9LIST|nr:phage portal protein [Listeria booriae]MBC1331032.1 phage portal protein [Listeria booriae]MBC2386342.1 phage portal protein [Listeria booriae]
MTADTINTLIKSPFQQAIGEQEMQRLNKQIESYNYYDGYQHIDPISKQLVRAEDLQRPAGFDYTPTRFSVNYFKRFINNKAQWQMAGKHGINVPVTLIDDEAARLSPDYEPSAAQKAESERAENYERLLYQLWDENDMRAKLLKAAKDRLIAERVAAKIVFNPQTGKITWVWHADTEVFPVYSNDDHRMLKAVHIIYSELVFDASGEEVELIRMQSFVLNTDDAGKSMCYLTEGYYTMELEEVKMLVRNEPMGIDFIPVVLFPVEGLIDSRTGMRTELDDMRQVTDRLNQLNEDAVDSLRFEMFPVTIFKNIKREDMLNIDIAPGAAAAINSDNEKSPDAQKLESNFTYGAALDSTFARLKGALHEITGIPNFTAQDLNFGGMNSEALQVLFHDIIQNTEEHWQTWGRGLAELHELTIRYLQARLSAPNFNYDKTIIRNIGANYKNEIKFVLPLPDNRKDLVELLIEETSAGFESVAGAMSRLGVENATAKKQEIDAEKLERRKTTAPYDEEQEGQFNE